MAAAPCAEATFPGKNGKIAYYKDPPEDLGAGSDIYSINPDGSGDTNLSRTYGLDEEADWSADGSALVFQSDRQDPFSNFFDLYRMNANGSGQTRITNFADPASGPLSAEKPSWSPDSTRIALSQGPRYGDPPAIVNPQALVINSDGTGLVSLAPDSYYEFAPAWSPRGDRIAWPGAIGSENDGIYTSRPDGSDPRLVVPGLWDNPNWSPDGSKLAFTSFGENDYVWIANSDGSGLHAVSNTFPALAPVWSPDGTKIAFSKIGSASTNVYVMDADGGNLTQFTNFGTGTNAQVSSWQPIPGPRRRDYKNAAQFCKAERDFLGESQFRAKYAGGANAHGKCVGQNQ